MQGIAVLLTMPMLRWHRPWPPALAVRGSSGAQVCPAPLAQPCPDGPTASPLERSHLSASECLTSCSITSLFREKVALVDTRL